MIGTVAADTTSDFTNPTSTTNTAGGGAVEKTFTDTGTETTSVATPPTSGNADESPYEQNPALNAAFAGTLNGGIKYFGSDASKPYPNPADGSFATGSYSGSENSAGASFSDAGATAIPRYPTNIYYNVATNAQEVDEYQTLYDSPPGGACVPITGVTTCNASGTLFTINQITQSVDLGMFGHMMGNDPRPSYFHQTNLMSQPGQGDGLFYETMNPLLTEYHQYFASNAPIEQYTMAQIATLLNDQAGWATAAGSQVTGNIAGNVVTVTNSGAAIDIPLTGITTVGSDYAGSHSGWVNVPTGPSTYTAITPWPAPPTVPVVPTPPTGPAPANGHTTLPGPPPPPATPSLPKTKTKKVVPPPPPFYYEVVQAAPTTVKPKNGKVTVSLNCVGKNGKAAKGHLCTGKFTLTVMGQKLNETFKVKVGKVDRVTVKLPKKARIAAAGKHHRKMKATLVISTKQPRGAAKVTRGTLTIKT